MVLIYGMRYQALGENYQKNKLLSVLEDEDSLIKIRRIISKLKCQ